ncbi:hypothetical protein NIES4071_20940 [Calothrix sp. NIES-4071]|nr:hypothetical protein NIES4071_20940 [Calothrix sp. NIES-4071]BAZ56426.1 hypothetical protein NIES4105_20890 [Calothrix sp. NIES-4105]
MSLNKMFYIKSIDYIDVDNLPAKEIKARKIAKYISLIPTYAGFAMIYVILMFFYIFGKNIGDGLQLIFLNGVIKPARFVWYKIIYWICKLLIR